MYSPKQRKQALHDHEYKKIVQLALVPQVPFSDCQYVCLSHLVNIKLAYVPSAVPERRPSDFLINRQLSSSEDELRKLC